MKKLGLTLFATLSIFMAKAQIVNVCGTDTIVLQVENYQNGIIEWQEATDTINWVNIPEVSGETYKFYPTQTKYYRAVVKTTDCSPLYSAVSLVQLSPVAYAGADRVIGNTSATLLGNEVSGSIGEWTILSGNGALLDNPTNPMALLTGINNEEYSLLWTLTNACGQSSDTVVISFNEIVAMNNFIVVDITDSIYSDSTEIAQGIYRIKFSDPTIAPLDSALLIGMRDDISFLRIVNAFAIQDSIYTFSTTQGTFQDLFESGVLNMGDAINQALTLEPSDLKNELSFPTRQTLEENSDNYGIKLLYVKTINGESFKETKTITNSTDQSGMTLYIDDATLFRSPGDNVSLSIKNAYVKIKPRFVLDYGFSFPATLTNLRLGVDNAEFEYNFSIDLLSKKAVDWSDNKTLLKLTKHIIFMAGLIPVDVVAKFEINATCELNMAAAIELEETKNYKINLTALVEGDDAKNLKLNYKRPVLTSTNKTNFIIQGELTSEFKIGPEISFLAYGIVGPFLNLPAKINMAVCANSNLNWEANASLGFEGTLGASADIVIPKTWVAPEMRLNLFHFEKSLFNNAFTKHIKMPYKLELMSGNNQNGIEGEKLSKPISLKAVSNLGLGIPLVPVRFYLESNNGSVTQNVLFTNGQGIVNTDWVLGSNPKNKLKVSVLDCDNNNIENSPIYIYANSTTQVYDCSNNNLSINLKTSQGNRYPSVSGGSPPYSYSKTGIDYSSIVPLFNISVPGNFIVYARDNNQCIKTKSFKIEPIDPCASSYLWIDVLVQPNILNLTGKNGTSPYEFSIDNTANYSTTNTYYQLATGKHLVYMKDANGCLASTEIAIANVPNDASIRSSFPSEGATSVPVTGFTFQWIAGNYAPNQVYDLYLKKDSDAYDLIAFNLNTTSYIYNTALANSSNFTWKLVVKGSNGVVIDFNEFTFSTASGIATTPTIPVIIAPANSAESVEIPITFKWTAQSGDFKYDLYLDETNASRLLANNLSDAEYTINNLGSGKAYYWKVKIKSTLTGESATSAVWSFTTQSSIANVTGTFTDARDGQTYTTIEIGNQIWMAENLNYQTTNSWWYENSSTNGDVYGRLYTWDDALTASPSGWHLPSDEEWKTLEMALGMSQSEADTEGYRGTDEGSKLKSTSKWYNNDYASNTSGFTALPGGYHQSSSGNFSSIVFDGNWWSSSEFSGSNAWSRYLSVGSAKVYRSNNDKTHGFSVRCVKEFVETLPTITTTDISEITETTAVSGGNVTGDGNADITARGVCWNNEGSPTIADSKTTDGSGIGLYESSLTGLAANTTYYVRAYATNNSGTAFGNEISFTTSSESGTTGTFTDPRDSQTYTTIEIGGQTWMAENLKYLPTVAGPGTESYTEPYYYVYGYYGTDVATAKATENYTSYGVLYNWPAAMNSAASSTSNPSGVQGACPSGWHLPSDSEWTQLSDYLINNGFGYEGSGDDISKSMAATSGWNISSYPGDIGYDQATNNSSGFTALPGGLRSNNGSFDSLGRSGIWWSSSEGSSSSAWYRYLTYSRGYVHRYYERKESGFSVRCLKD